MSVVGFERCFFALRSLVGVFLLVFATSALAKDSATLPSMQKADGEIEQLIQRVGQSDCLFARNGKFYEATKAEAHLRLKWRRGKKYAATSEAFIDNLASFSSWSNKPYYLQCGDQEPQRAKQWFDTQLMEIRETQP